MTWEIEPKLLNELKSRDDAVRNRAIHNWQETLLVEAKSHHLNTGSQLESGLINRIFAYCSSPSPDDKLVGISAIDAILGVLPPEEVSTAVKLAANVLKALPCPDPFVMSRAARTYARLAQVGGILMTGTVDIQLKQTIEWLQGERVEFRRWAAVLLLRELSKTVPSLLYEQIPNFLDNLWTALRDPKVAIREVAAGALSGCLRIAHERDGALRKEWYTMVYDQAAKGFKMNTPDAIHGSLLGYQELFLRAGLFMQTRYREVCDQIIAYREHREALIRQTVIGLMSVMAQYSPHEFTTLYLGKCMNFLLTQLKRDRDRAISFHAIGNIAMAVEHPIAPYLDEILLCVREGLQARGKKNAPPEAAIFSCISMLAKGAKLAVTKHVHEMLNLMFAYGLSAPLVEALSTLAAQIPPLLTLIQDRLLDTLSNILAGEPFRHPGAPYPRNGLLSGVPHSVESHDPAIVSLALRTLGSFDFSGHILSEFVATTVVSYLGDDSADVRLAASETTCKLFAADPILGQTSTHSIKTVSEVLEKVLTVAVADLDPHIRKATLACLMETNNFDRHLAQAENVRSLFIAMNDEDFEIRQLAIQCIGRLSQLNPAYAMPSLRKTLIQLLTEIEFSSKDREKEQAAILLSQLVRTSARITKPYVLPMLKVLLPKARDRSPEAASAIMLALGDLASVGGEDVLVRLEEYMDLIADNLHDQASGPKRAAALKTLSQFASSSGYVIEPYQQKPSLLATLINILQTEQDVLVKRETVKAMGILGALDPYYYTSVERQTIDITSDSARDSMTAEKFGPSQEDSYYPATAFRALLAILRDPSLNSHHTAVVEAIMYIFRSLRLRCVQFLPQIIPAYLQAMRTCPPKLEDYYIQNLGHLIATVKQHIRSHLPPILQLVAEFWQSNAALQVILVDLIESIALAMEGEFKVHLPVLLPLLLQAFEAEGTDSRRVTTQLRVLRAFGGFGANLEEYLHLCIPVIVKVFERVDNPLSVRKAAIVCIGTLSRKINFTEHASRVVHPLIRLLNTTSSTDLQQAAVDDFCSLLTHIGPDFAIFVPIISKTLAKHKIQHQAFEGLVAKLLKGESLPVDYGPPLLNHEEVADPAADAGVNKLPVNQQNLKSAWENVTLSSEQNAKPEDWRGWLKRLSVQMLKSSPSHSLRACANLAEVYQPLARELFNAAFVSCWSELYDNYQDELVRAIEIALTSATVPTDIMQTLLNLAEFMEHDDKMLPIPVSMLGTYANRCHAYAKALHYKESEFFSSNSNSYEVVEDLIRINNLLQQPDVAMGILKFAQKHFEMTSLSEDWYERLERWEDALAAYTRKQEEDPNNFDYTLGRMRCLHALGEWESLANLAGEHWKQSSLEVKRKIAPLGAASAWGQQDWKAMDDFVSVLKHDSADRAWFRSILHIHRNNFGKAQSNINKARDLLVGELTTLVGESYTRAYNQVVRVQMLSELEEIMQYKESLAVNTAENRERRHVIFKMWMKRLKGCQRDVEVWQRILKVRALVMNPKDSMDMWIKFANLCRKSGRMGLAEKTINSISGEDDEASILARGPPHVIYASLKLRWAKGDKEETLAYLQDFTTKLSGDLGIGPMANAQRRQDLIQSNQLGTFTRLLARCNYKQAEWAMALTEDWGSDAVTHALTAYKRATLLDPKWYKAWHSWALANSEVVAHYMRTRPEPELDPIPSEVFTGYLIPSAQAFFQSIALSPGNSLQDTLRLLTLWFNYGYQNDLSAAIQEGFGTVPMETWLEVIPQLIARIHAPAPNVRRLVQRILADVGRAHPQALVYALTVAAKYPSAPRRRAALNILDKMRDHSATLVDQAVLVAQELMRVAILWYEKWADALEEASRLYFGEHDTQAMFATLEPLHEELERGPETIREIAFEQKYGHDLREARQSLRRFRAVGENDDLHQAWDLYYGVFRRIQHELKSIFQVELESASPKLLAAKDLDLAVPGTYSVSKKNLIRITKFAPVLDVLTSKQRPRKCKITGSDGHEYPFLLKGHEDIRQDERVMQLFGLCNTLLAKDPETFKRHLVVQKYPAIPLSTNSGLLGWLPNTDTMHVLIRDFRESREILLTIEQRLITQMAPDYDHLTLMQKIEVFQYALDNTTGQDLYRVLWLKSKTSEAWLDRRSNYSRSLAVMSMVGYILGLGDRHPSNLLLSRENGIVIHVDYGDCFEVAMVRDKYPEKVPFRLTRMLQNAMDVSKIEGSFRVTCEHTMRVLRENRESIIAVLEAFSRDPLVNWRLMTGGRRIETVPVNPTTGAQARASSHEQNVMRRPRAADESNQFDGEAVEELNRRALEVVERVTQKLTGKDFKPNVVNTIDEQVDLLIKQATAMENLCTAFVGWCAFW